MLNPINHTRTAADIDRYKAEPYVMAGDVYARPPHAGRGGWSWYTGSAAWMYRAGLESMLGLRRRGATFSVDPCIPSSWPGYEIVVALPEHAVPDRGRQSGTSMPGVLEATLDGVVTDVGAIPLADDGGMHHVRVVMGSAASSVAPASSHLSARF